MQWNKHSVTFVIVCIIPLLFSSCGFFEKTAKPEDQTLNQTQIQIQDKAELNANEIIRINTRTDDLEKRMETAHKKIDENRLVIEELKNQILHLESQIKSFEKREITPSKTSKTPKKNPESLYNKARTLLLEKQFSKAATDFSSFIEAFPEHHLIDNAHYWLGECHYSQGSYQQAIILFKSLVKKYPKSPKVPDALLKTGYAYLAVDDTNRAHHYLKQVVKKYPFSEASEKAEDRLSQPN